MIFRRKTRRLIPETPGAGRLGRHLHHDPRSKDFVANQALLRSVVHRHFSKVLDQGQLGSCTGNALAQALNTAPLHKTGRNLTESDAVSLYSLATQIDPFPGQYPPTDTGSDGLDVCKAGVQKGYLTGYDHAFGIDQALGALVLSPVITGVNWHAGMDTPDASGLVHATGPIRGGHEFCVLGLNTKTQLVKCINSWGTAWGMGGYFYLSFADWESLLNAKGDVTVPK